MIAHGHVDIVWRENIFLVHAIGPFNIDGISLAFEQLKQSVEEKQFARWHRVDFLDELAIGCPEVMKVIGDSYRWSCGLPSCQSVSVCCETPLQEDMLQRFIRKVDLDIQVFDCPERAQAFVDELVAKQHQQN